MFLYVYIEKSNSENDVLIIVEHDKLPKAVKLEKT